MSLDNVTVKNDAVFNKQLFCIKTVIWSLQAITQDNEIVLE